MIAMRYILLPVLMLASSVAGASSGGEAVHGNPTPNLHLVFMLVNFIVLVLGLFALIKKPIKVFFAQRSLVLKQSVGKSKELYEQALAESKVVQEKLKNLDTECQRVMSDVKDSGVDEGKKIMLQAAEFAKKIDKDARQMVQNEIARANEELKDLTVKYIQQLSREYIKKEINESDEKKLAGSFLKRLQDS